MIVSIAAAAVLSSCSGQMSGLDYRICLGKLEQEITADLVAQWKLTRASVQREDQENEREHALIPSLEQSEKAWLSYRDVECEMVANQWAGGTGESERWAKCRIDLTIKRIATLKKRDEGNLFPEF